METRITKADLTAPGSTDPIYIGELAQHGLQFRLDGISTDLALKVEASNNDKNDPPDADNEWYNAAEDNEVFTFVADVTDCFRLPGLAANWLRLTFVSFTGGTPAVRDIQYIGVSQGGR